MDWIEVLKKKSRSFVQAAYGLLFMKTFCAPVVLVSRKVTLSRQPMMMVSLRLRPADLGGAGPRG